MGDNFKETTSMHMTKKEEGAHVFEIEGYSLEKAMAAGKCIESATFTVGGYDWAIQLHFGPNKGNSKYEVKIMLKLKSKAAKVKVLFHMGLLGGLNHKTGFPCECFKKKKRVFNGSFMFGFGVYGADMAQYIHDDRITIKCVLTVIKGSHVHKTRGYSEIEVPPSDITEHLGKIFEAKEGADVTLSVGGEIFQAHKILLAARSPVFKAELYGLLMESRTLCVTIEDVQPAVFRALLHFIYTDSLPDLGDLEGDDNHEMIRHLLVAADRYAMNRLKMVCQHILANKLDVESVVVTYALADQHSFDKLKHACIEFVASSPDKMDDVMKTKGYADLKSSCPSLVVDLFEKSTVMKFCKAKRSSSSSS